MNANSNDYVGNRFTSIDLTKHYNKSIAALSESDCSARVIHNSEHLLTGEHELWGIPFSLGPNEGSANIILLKDEDIHIDFKAPLHDHQLIFLHSADFKETITNEDGITSPMMGTPRLGELVCEYKLIYSDGTEAVIPIKRRYQISEFQVKWGENGFEAVKHIKPRTMRTNSDIPRGEAPEIPWGQSQLRNTFQGFGSVMHHWIYSLQNPYPDKELTRLVLHPIDGTAFIFGITRTNMVTNPLRWDVRRKVYYTSKPGFVPNPFGNNPNIRLDFGEVISVSPVLEYNHSNWIDHANPSLPIQKSNEWIIELTAHSEAYLYLGEDEENCIALKDLTAYTEFQPMETRKRKVTLKTIDKISGQPVPSKIHIHGKFGDYIPPVNGHRIPNAHWFEDYGTEHVQGNHFSCYINGEAEFNLPYDTVYIEVTKGFEIKPIRKTFTITDEMDSIEIILEHVLPWRSKGWVTADTHVHFLSPQTALLEGEAEGVNVVNLLTSQWGEMFSNLGDFDGKTTIGSVENGGSGEYLVRVGTENRQHILGHISLLGYSGKMILPLCTGGPDESGLGDPVDISITQWARLCREQNGISVIPHLPNPRAEEAATIVLGEADAIELCSFENKGINPYSLSDWYRYLNCGYLLPAVGGTDKMSQETAVGTIRTYALIKDLPFTYDNWMKAVRQGQTFATFGPLLEFQVNGHEMGTKFELRTTGGTVDIVWQVSSATIPVTKVELIVNGELREVFTADPERITHGGHWSLKVTGSSWIAMRVRGCYHDQTEIIAAHSSAVMVTVEGKPCFNSADAVTILEQIEGSTAYVKTLATQADERAYKKLLMALTSAHRELHHRMHHHGVMHRHSAQDHHDGHSH